MNIKKAFVFIVIAFQIGLISAQEINVLFLGNSYTQVNNLPSAIVNLTQSASHSMMVESNTPGGCTFEMHAQNETSLQKIRKGGWDYVVLQEQSQMPSIDYYRYHSMYPSAEKLRDSIKKYNPCAEIILYMTWGRRDGGQQCENYGDGLYCSADFRDFDHMQDTMTSAYYELTKNLSCICSPAGEAWRTAIHQTDFNLFSNDGSHPSQYGTYLTACVMFANIWNESPIGLNTAFEISEEEALTLQTIANETVFESGTEWNLTPKVKAIFKIHLLDDHTVKLRNDSQSPYPNTSYLWDFGDGSTSEETSPIHTYTASGTYTIKLTVSSCLQSDSIEKPITIEMPNTTDESIYGPTFYPNPTDDLLHFENAQYGTIIINNALGQYILQKQLRGETQIDLSQLKSGMYFVTLQGKETLNFKLIKR